VRAGATLPLSSYRADNGAAYERFLRRWSRLLAGPFVDFAKPPEEGGVLDIGCGAGSVALVLAERGWRGRTTGIDAAHLYVAFARPRQGAAGIDFTVADACRLPYVECSFIAALAQLSLNFVGDAAKAGERNAAGRLSRRGCRHGGVGGARDRTVALLTGKLVSFPPHTEETSHELERQSRPRHRRR
jgi:SAM-dependent methyltransferase